MNHYQWLDKNLESFWIKVTGKTLDESGCAGIVSAHGDKCYGYRMAWEKAGVPFHHGVAIYFLTYIHPFSGEARETPNGEWVDPKKWVADNYERFKPFLNE
jgi:hypothetical protein